MQNQPGLQVWGSGGGEYCSVAPVLKDVVEVLAKAMANEANTIKIGPGKWWS
jgi:hypothetical protein